MMPSPTNGSRRSRTVRWVGVALLAAGAVGVATVADDLRHIGELTAVGVIIAVGAFLVVASFARR